MDGNVDPNAIQTALARWRDEPNSLVGVTVMPGPQVAPAIADLVGHPARPSRRPHSWGGYFPTLYPDAAINAPYVDYVVRGQGEQTLLELLAHLDGGSAGGPDSARPSGRRRDIAGLTWKRDGVRFTTPSAASLRQRPSVRCPTTCSATSAPYLRPTFMGARTAVHQAALGCRYRCEFCGVVSMWNGKTVLDEPARVRLALEHLRDRWGADSVQFYDHNFFDREETSLAAGRSAGGLDMPWWCYARADTLAAFAPSTWEKLRRSRLRMAYIGAEAASDESFKRMQKGARVNDTLEVAARCREYGVIPELSFVLGGPEDPEGEVEQTFAFIRRLEGAQSRMRDRPLLLQPDASARPPAPASASGARAAAAARACAPMARPDPLCPARRKNGRSALGQLRLPSGRPLAHPAAAPAGARLRPRAGVPVSDRPGSPDTRLGQGDLCATWPAGATSCNATTIPGSSRWRTA